MTRYYLCEDLVSHIGSEKRLTFDLGAAACSHALRPASLPCRSWSSHHHSIPINLTAVHSQFGTAVAQPHNKQCKVIVSNQDGRFFPKTPCLAASGTVRTPATAVGCRRREDRTATKSRGAPATDHTHSLPAIAPFLRQINLRQRLVQSLRLNQSRLTSHGRPITSDAIKLKGLDLQAVGGNGRCHLPQEKLPAQIIQILPM